MIVNGDDFGLNGAVNAGIIRAHREGILTSTSLMVVGEACAEAVALAQSHPRLAVGLHLVLVQGRSVLAPERIPHLVDGRGRFPDNPVVAGLRYQFHPQAEPELRLEIRAQLEKFQLMGLRLSHLDGHLHLHCHPKILRIVTELAAEFAIPAIRLPYEEPELTLKLDSRQWLSKLIQAQVFRYLRLYGESLLSARGIDYPQRVYGLLQTGRMTEAYLCGLIPQIQANLVEIYLHPTTASQALAELEAMLSPKVRRVLAETEWQLTHYPELHSFSGH